MQTHLIHIICHANCEPHGYLCTYLDQRNIPYIKTHAIEDELLRLDLDTIAGLIFMGGPHSVYEDHAWLDDEITFIQKAIEKDIPAMGVCFGAQLISKALGARVCGAAHMETGWHRIETNRSKLHLDPVLALADTFEAFQWHEDTFSVPEGAIPLFKGSGIENQGYLYGRTLTMQFHLEMTEYMVHEWLARYNDCLPPPSHSVQSPDQITERLHERLEQLHTVADTIYGWWLDMANLK